MSFSAVTVTGTYQHEDLTAASGTVSFTLTEPISNSGVTLTPVAVTAVLDATGSFSLSLPANDDPGTTPDGSQYIVIEEVTGVPYREYTVVVPSGAGSVTLASLMPGPPGFE